MATLAKLAVQLIEAGHSDMAKALLLSKTKNSTKASKQKAKRTVSLNNPQYPVASALAELFAKVEENGYVRFTPKSGEASVEFNDRRFYGGAKEFGYKVSDLMELPLLADGEKASKDAKVNGEHGIVNATLRFYYEACDRA